MDFFFLIIFCGAGYTLHFHYGLLCFKGGNISLRADIKGMCFTSRVMLRSPVLLLYFHWKGEKLSAALFLVIFFSGPNDPFDFTGVPLFFSLPKIYLVKSNDFRHKTDRHKQALSKLPKLVLGTKGGPSYMSLDLWHSCAKEVLQESQ